MVVWFLGTTIVYVKKLGNSVSEPISYNSHFCFVCHQALRLLPGLPRFLWVSCSSIRPAPHKRSRDSRPCSACPPPSRSRVCVWKPPVNQKCSWSLKVITFTLYVRVNSLIYNQMSWQNAHHLERSRNTAIRSLDSRPVLESIASHCHLCGSDVTWLTLISSTATHFSV